MVLGDRSRRPVEGARGGRQPHLSLGCWRTEAGSSLCCWPCHCPCHGSRPITCFLVCAPAPSRVPRRHPSTSPEPVFTGLPIALLRREHATRPGQPFISTGRRTGAQPCPGVDTRSPSKVEEHRGKNSVRLKREKGKPETFQP